MKQIVCDLCKKVIPSNDAGPYVISFKQDNPSRCYNLGSDDLCSECFNMLMKIFDNWQPVDK